MACAQSSAAPEQVKPYIQSIPFQAIGGQTFNVNYSVLPNGVVKATLQWTLADSVQQNDWQAVISPALQPSFHWAPHLTPTILSPSTLKTDPSVWLARMPPDKPDCIPGHGGAPPAKKSLK